jgi:hypothetical protein
VPARVWFDGKTIIIDGRVRNGQTLNTNPNPGEERLARALTYSVPHQEHTFFNGNMLGPNLAVHGFSRYLTVLELAKIPLITYTLREIRFHTPAEHEIDGLDSQMSCI